MKRLFDFVASGCGLLVLSPVLILVAIWIKLDSKGPVFYRQVRVGRYNKDFRIFKFRSMRVGADKGSLVTIGGRDPRITRSGYFIRKFKIDELPQLIYVFVGDMSLVGPRPEREYYIIQIMAKAPYYTLIHQVRPGITSWGMVKYGYASDVDGMVERLRYDLLYIENVSLLVDLKILFYTVQTVFTGKGI